MFFFVISTKWPSSLKSVSMYFFSMQTYFCVPPDTHAHVKTCIPSPPRDSLTPDIFVRNSTADRGQIKRRLLRDLKMPYVCRRCHNSMFEDRDGIPFWFGKPVTLQLEHRNGISSDNRLDNLEFLCPLCHSQTDTYAGRNSLAARAKRARRLVESHENSRPLSSPSRPSVPVS